MIVHYQIRPAALPPDKRLLQARRAEWRESAEMLSNLTELQRKSKERILKSRLKHADALQKLWDKRW